LNLNKEKNILNEENQEMTCFYFDLNIPTKIENLFLLNYQLIVVSKTSVYDLEISNCPVEISYEIIFNNQEDAKTEKVIKDVEFIKKHLSLYMMIRNDDDLETIFCKFSLDENAEERLLVNKLKKKVDRFEVSTRDPLELFLICKTRVLSYFLKNISTTLNFLLKQKYSNKNIDRNKPLEIRVQNKKFKEIYSNQINRIQFFKFDKDMKYFYTHDKSMIKTCLFETGEEVSTMFTTGASVRNLWFTDNFQFMIR
jgi:hypothetical protein